MFAEYNAESPAGLGYTEVLAGVFSELPIMARFREHYDAVAYPLMDTMLEALRETLRSRLAADPLVSLCGEDIEDPMRFYLADGDDDLLARNMTTMVESVTAFLDMDRIRLAAMSEHLLKTWWPTGD